MHPRHNRDTVRPVPADRVSQLLSLIDAAQTGFSMERRSDFLMGLSRSLPPWLIAAALFPIVRAVFRRAPLDLRPRSIAIHTAGAAVYALGVTLSGARSR